MSDLMLDKLKHHWNVSNRREFFTRAGSGLAGIALAAMLAEDSYAAAVDPLAPKSPTVNPVRAKNIIWCFMEGGPSQVDLFDPKPLLEKLAFQPVPPSFRPETLLTAQGAKPSDGLFPARRPFKQYGQSGMWVSDWLPPYRSARRRDGGHPFVYIRCQQSRWWRVPDEYRFYSRRASLAGAAWLTYGLGSAQRNPPPPTLRGHAGRQGNLRRGAELRFGFPARDVSGVAVPSGRYTDSGSEAARGNHRSTASATSSSF